MSKFNSDKPINLQEEDFFHRYEFSKRIADSIKEYEKPDSVVFGISGVWGEGKTSVLNFIESELLSSHPDIICLRFNPWRYNDETVLLSSLFNSLASKIKDSLEDKEKKKIFFKKPIFLRDDDDLLKREIEIIGDLLKDYGEIASVLGLGKVVKSIGKSLSGVDIQDKKIRIENMLEKLKRRLVIFIDDIDRLDKNEIYTILKIVKLTGDFKYMTYILSFDEDMVASAISERFGNTSLNSGYKFLEKIIQVPLIIPKAKKNDLKEFCFRIVFEAITENEIDLKEKDRFKREFTKHILGKLNTPRLAIRYGNSLRFIFPILKNEVNIVDLMLIEGVKIFHPELYEFIKHNIFKIIENYDYYLKKETLELEVKELMKEANELSNFSCEKNDDGIKILLQSLFPQLIYSRTNSKSLLNEWNNERRICSQLHFDKYFSYSTY